MWWKVRTRDGTLQQLWYDNADSRPPLRLHLADPFPSLSSSLFSKQQQQQQQPQDYYLTIRTSTLLVDVWQRFIILQYLPQDDWLSIEATCRTWHAMVRPLWPKEMPSFSQSSPTTSSPLLQTRSQVIAFRRLQRVWRRLESFLPAPSRRALCGPVAPQHLDALVKEISQDCNFHDENDDDQEGGERNNPPNEMSHNGWTLPDSLMASLRLHDGQSSEIGWCPANFYLGARLLTAHEMLQSVHEFQQKRRHEYKATRSSLQNCNPGEREEVLLFCHDDRNNNNYNQILRVPLLTEQPSAPRQVVMELWQSSPLPSRINTNHDPQTPRGGKEQQHPFHRPPNHGRIVLINTVAPTWTPPVRVLADSWESFLTLV